MNSYQDLLIQDLRIRGLFADEKDEPKSKEGEKKKKIKKRKKKPGETSSPEPAEKIEKKEEVHWMEEGDDGEEDRIEHEPYAEAFLRPQYKVLKVFILYLNLVLVSSRQYFELQVRLLI